MHILYTGQLIDAAKSAGIEGTDEIVQVIHQAQSKLADIVARHLNIQHGATTFEMGEIGSSFGPRNQGQLCPEHLANYDDCSDWVTDPEATPPIIPMIVLYRAPGTQAPLDPPRAFRCCAQDSDHAEALCASYNGTPIEILWVVETDSEAVAFDSYWRADEPRPELAELVSGEPTINDAQEIECEGIIDGDHPFYLEALKEGWAVFECTGSTDGDWQVQGFHESEDEEKRFGITIPHIEDDEAWKMVAQGEKPHHVAAKEFLKKRNPKEYAHIMEQT